MGLFSKEECCLCEKKIGALNRIKIEDGFICGECSLKCSQGLNFQYIDISGLKEHIKYREANEKVFSNFKPTVSVKPYIYIDYNSKQWYIQTDSKKRTPDVFSFNDIVNFEYVEDGDTIFKSKGTIGRAVVGGMLFGGTGAVVGSNSGKSIQKETIKSAYIRISLKNKYINERKIELVTIETKKNGLVYKTAKSQAESIISNLERIRSESNDFEIESTATSSAMSNADEILKFKNLLDAGVITQEEFNEKKKQLLDL